jgi:hypothetical protein
MTLPLSNGAEQVVVQTLMPAGFDETDPVPITCAVSVGRLKFAITVVLAINVKVQVPVPPHPAPIHPVKVEIPFGVALNSIMVPTG